jgi:hypothetical protein
MLLHFTDRAAYLFPVRTMVSPSRRNGEKTNSGKTKFGTVKPSLKQKLTNAATDPRILQADPQFMMGMNSRPCGFAILPFRA